MTSDTEEWKPQVLISSAGRRVGLVKLFQEAGADVYCCDVNPELSPACMYVRNTWGYNRAFTVPSCKDNNFIGDVTDRCEDLGIDLIIPTIDPELAIYAKYHDSLAREAIVSSLSTIEICADKMLMYEVLKTFMDKVLETYTDINKVPYDSKQLYTVKPKNGSGSAKTFNAVNFPLATALFQQYNPTTEMVIQPFVKSEEVTVYCYTDEWGNLLDVRAHKRIEVRHGEVSKGRSLSEQDYPLAREYARTLNKELRFFGPWCFQIIDQYVTDINPRFGGGYPLAHKTGARFPELCLLSLSKNPVKKMLENFLAYKPFTMLRFDDALYIEE